MSWDVEKRWKNASRGSRADDWSCRYTRRLNRIRRDLGGVAGDGGLVLVASCRSPHDAAQRRRSSVSTDPPSTTQDDSTDQNILRSDEAHFRRTLPARLWTSDTYKPLTLTTRPPYCFDPRLLQGDTVFFSPCIKTSVKHGELSSQIL